MMNYPAIFVERPHQRPSSAYLVQSERDLPNLGDNWNWDRYESRAAMLDQWGGDAPESLTSYTGAFPAVAIRTPFGDLIEPEAVAQSYESLVREYLAHDLHGFDALESADEVDQWLRDAGHNKTAARSTVLELARELGWIEAPLDWAALLVTNDDGQCVGTLGEFIETGDLDGIVLKNGEIDSWSGYYISAKGEAPDHDTPRRAVNWDGFADAVSDVAQQN